MSVQGKYEREKGGDNMTLEKIYVLTDERRLLDKYRHLDSDRRLQLEEKACVLLYQQERERREMRERAEREMKAI